MFNFSSCKQWLLTRVPLLPYDLKSQQLTFGLFLPKWIQAKIFWTLFLLIYHLTRIQHKPWNKPLIDWSWATDLIGGADYQSACYKSFLLIIIHNDNTKVWTDQESVSGTLAFIPSCKESIFGCLAMGGLDHRQWNFKAAQCSFSTVK